MNISNVTNNNVYLNNNINTNREKIEHEKNNILKTENIYNAGIENNITDEYIEKISSLSRGNIPNTSDFNEGLINIISDNETQIKYVRV